MGHEKKVLIDGKDDQYQIKAVFVLIGNFLPLQLVYQGKTTKCLPSFQFPPDEYHTYGVMKEQWNCKLFCLTSLRQIEASPSLLLSRGSALKNFSNYLIAITLMWF